MVEAAHRRQALVKVIFENCMLKDEHKEQLCRICGEVRADFVKTSTGYGDGGATDDDLRLTAPLFPAARPGQGRGRGPHLRSSPGRTAIGRRPRRGHRHPSDPG